MDNGTKNINIPSGTRDIVLDEAALYSDIEERLGKVFAKNGFDEIRTPAIEYYDVYNYEEQSISQESMYKLTDNNGRLLVLRPDNTMPAARVTAARLKGDGLPRKLRYNQSIYRIYDGYSGRRGEVFQSGVELIGAGGLKSDLICVSTAIDALKSLGIPFKLEIGHVGYFNALLGELELSDAQKKLTRNYVDAKKSVSLNMINRSADFSKIRKIPLLFGGGEVIASAERLAEGNAEALAALEYVRELYLVLTGAGLGEHIMIDMGIVHNIDYYTGVVFVGYIEGAGEPALAGGRYDRLLGHFGYEAAATGFAVNVCAVADAMRDKTPRTRTGEKRVILFDIERFAEAQLYKAESERGGVVCEYSPFDTLDETIKYAVAREAASVAYISAAGVTVTEVNK